MLGAGWYGQGLRLLDISDASDMRQVGYYRVTGTGAGQPVLELVGHGVLRLGRRSKSVAASRCD